MKTNRRPMFQLYDLVWPTSNVETLLDEETVIQREASGVEMGAR